MALFGIKTNKCFARGVQGVTEQLEYTASPGTDIFSYNATPENNCRFVLEEYISILIGKIPTHPEPSYNFYITLKNSTGFYGELDAVFTLTDADITESGNQIKVYWDNPSFDLSADYTVVHVHIWHDGINYCGHIDGYIETT